MKITELERYDKIINDRPGEMIVLEHYSESRGLKVLEWNFQEPDAWRIGAYTRGDWEDYEFGKLKVERDPKTKKRNIISIILGLPSA